MARKTFILCNPLARQDTQFSSRQLLDSLLFCRPKPQQPVASGTPRTVCIGIGCDDVQVSVASLGHIPQPAEAVFQQMFLPNRPMPVHLQANQPFRFTKKKSPLQAGNASPR